MSDLSSNLVTGWTLVAMATISSSNHASDGGGCTEYEYGSDAAKVVDVSQAVGKPTVQYIRVRHNMMLIQMLLRILTLITL